MKRLGQQPCDFIIRLVRAWQEGGFFYVQMDLAEKDYEDSNQNDDSFVGMLFHSVESFPFVR
jgi:hypothetical protein